MTITEEPDGSASDGDLEFFSGSQDFLAHPQPAYAEMRRRRPLIRIPGLAVSTTRQALDETLRRPEIFSSGMGAAPLGNDRPLIPLQIDPPDHLKYRKLLDPLFAPRQMARLEPAIAARVNELIDTFIDRGSCDFTNEYAIPLPSTVFLELMGLPLGDLPQLLEFNEHTQRPGGGSPEEQLTRRHANALEIYAYFGERIAERRRRPAAEDLMGRLLSAEVEGRRLTDHEIIDICFLLILAGLDTVTDTLTCSFKYLAEHPDQRRRIVEAPEIIPAAVEEMLRWETPVMNIIRVAEQDAEIQGCPVNKGEVVVACLGSANTDEAEFERPDLVDLERNPNRHVAFGGGVHRCLGSHLARLEVRITLRQWHQRIPDYELPAGFVPRYSDGLRSVRNLELRFPAGGAGA